MRSKLSDPELISAIINREPRAAALLYDQYAATLFKIIYCSVRNKELAEAVLEKTMHITWHNCKDSQLQNKPLLLWMAGVARNLAQQAKH